MPWRDCNSRSSGQPADAAAAPAEPKGQQSGRCNWAGGGLFMEWAVGKQGEIDAAGLARTVDAAWFQDCLGGSLPFGRRANHQLRRARNLLLSEG